MTRASIVTVIGASGGVGASVFSAALAGQAARTGEPVVVLDGNPCGGGLDVVLGVDHERGLRWADLARARGSLDAPAILRELPTTGGVHVLSHGRTGQEAPPDQAVTAVIDSLAACVGTLVIDAPRPPAQAAPYLEPADDAVLLVGATPPALAAAGVIARLLESCGPRLWLAQRLGRGDAELPYTVAEALGLPLCAAVPDDPHVAADLRKGAAPGRRGPLADAADAAHHLLSAQRRRAA